MFVDLKREYPSSLLLFLILIVGSIYLFSDSMSSYPSFVHAWTQSDRLALALNFQENGFDLFHPATYNLLTKGGITQVDFPIHDYCVALISKLFTTDIISTFRWYNLIYSLVGILFLFRFCLSLKMSGIRSIFACTFLFTLPFWVYYQNGFLPSTPSLANLFIGLYFLSNYWNSSKVKTLIISILFLSLAALARAPFLIYLVAAIALLFFRQYVSKKLNSREILLSVCSIGLFISYWFYNKSLGDTYGSMFLMEFRPISSLSEFMQVIRAALDRWSHNLMSPFHAILLVLVLLSLVYNRKLKMHPLLLWLGISVLGMVLFFFLMGKQFIDHDYYYIDCFLPILSLIWIFALVNFKLKEMWYSPFATLSLIFFFYFFSYASDSQAERYTPKWNDRVNYAYSAYLNASNDLHNWGIRPDDTLIVLDANSTNIPFTLWKNRGYTSLNSHRDSVDKILKNPADYIVLVDSFFRTDSYRDYPDLINRLERVNGNGELTVYKLTEHNSPNLFFKKLYFNCNFDFEELPADRKHFPSYISIKETDTAYSKAHYLDESIEYGLTYFDSLYIEDKTSDLEISILADYYQVEDTSKMQLVCEFGSNYYSHFMENTLVEVNTWKRAYYRFKIPKDLLKDFQEVKIYYWNQHHKQVLIDNFHLNIYQ